MNIARNFIVSAVVFASAGFIFPTNSASAFDCAKARTPVEKAICSDRRAKNADDLLEDTYRATKRGLDTFAQEELKFSQRGWLKFRATMCLTEVSCLADVTQKRALALTASAQVEPRMIPVFAWQEGTPDAYTVLITGMRFASPANNGQTVFNKAIDKAIADAPINESTGDQGIGSWEHEKSITITQHTARLISATIGSYDFSGGAHPNSWTKMINVDLQSGRALKMTEVFDANAIETLITSCRDQVIDDKSNVYDGTLEESRKRIEEDYPDEVRKHITDSTTWSFTDEGASVTFDSYEIGPYAEGPQDCKFSTQTLADLANNPDLLAR